MFVRRKGHQVIEDDIVHYLRDLSAVATGVLRLPTGIEYGVEDLFDAGVLRIASMEFNKPSCPLRIEQKLQRMLRGRFRWSKRIKRRAGANLEVLSPTFIIWGRGGIIFSSGSGSVRTSGF